MILFRDLKGVVLLQNFEGSFEVGLRGEVLGRNRQGLKVGLGDCLLTNTLELRSDLGLLLPFLGKRFFEDELLDDEFTDKVIERRGILGEC